MVSRMGIGRIEYSGKARLVIICSVSGNMAARRETETSFELTSKSRILTSTRHETLAPEEGWRILSISNSRCWLVGTVH